MSAIFGLVRRDGSAVTDAELETMREPMGYWGRDGGGIWRGGCAGLGQLVARRTPEDAHERGPVAVADGTAIVTAAARLDNRDELLTALGVPAPQRDATADGTLVALAYERWAERTPERLRGDWSYAAWHPRDRRLMVSRDHYGHTAIYWYRRGSTLAFASSLKGLLALPDVPVRLNEAHLAETLVVCAADGAQTMYENIQRLPTARTLRFDHGGARVREYWSLHDVQEARLGNDGEYVERVLDLLGRAVRARLRACGPIATTLSAGLDSAAVTAVAARELDGEPLTAYTGRPAYPEATSEMPELLIDEWRGARLVAERYPNLRHTEVTGAQVTPLTAIARSLWIHDEPEHAVPNLPWVTALLDQARDEGHSAVVTGQMGNGSVSWPGDRRGLLTAVARGDLADAVRALRHARASGRGGWRGALWRAVVLPLRAQVTAELMRRNPARQPGVATSLIAPGFAERIDLAEHVRATGWDPGGARASARDRRLAYLLPGKLPVTAWWHQRSAAHGIDVRDPTIDIALVEFCVATPDDQYARDGENRWLMRRALAKLVPAETAWNTRRGAQGADIAYRLRADGDAVGTAVQRLAASDLVGHYLDTARIEELWKTVRTGTSEGALELSRGLQTGNFLLRFTDRPAV